MGPEVGRPGARLDLCVVFVCCFPPAVSGSPGAHSLRVVTPGYVAAYRGC